MTKEILDEKSLAERWGISVRTLQHWRQHDKGPTYTELGEGTVRYRLEDVKAYEVTRRKTKTTTKEENHVE